MRAKASLGLLHSLSRCFFPPPRQGSSPDPLLHTSQLEKSGTVRDTAGTVIPPLALRLLVQRTAFLPLSTGKQQSCPASLGGETRMGSGPFLMSLTIYRWLSMPGACHRPYFSLPCVSNWDFKLKPAGVWVEHPGMRIWAPVLCVVQHHKHNRHKQALETLL